MHINPSDTDYYARSMKFISFHFIVRLSYCSWQSLIVTAAKTHSYFRGDMLNLSLWVDWCLWQPPLMYSCKKSNGLSWKSR